MPSGETWLMIDIQEQPVPARVALPAGNARYSNFLKVKVLQ